MKAYLINLDRCPERLAAADAELKAAGVAYERMRAIDGRALSAGEIRRNCNRLAFLLANGRRVKTNELACALSHMACYRAGLAAGEPFFAVFEDDLTVNGAAFADAARRIAAENDPAKPTVWLLNRRNRVSDPGRPCSVRLLDTPDDVMHTWGGEGYVLNRAAAERILAFAYPVRYVLDAWPTYARHGVEVRIVFPTACGIRDTPSVIARTATGRAAWDWYQRFGWFKYRVGFWLDILWWRLVRGRRFRKTTQGKETT